MCGVIGYVSEKHRDDLGHVASELLRQLEYRGYDSTGAIAQGEGLEIAIAKGVGAPSKVIAPLGITKMAGSILCGQVRWATFGAVDDKNAQPHLVRCKTLFYGAHNGNVTNCDDLKRWLSDEGHAVVSDNDGEMVVHVVEHFFALELATLDAAAMQSVPHRAAALRRAVDRGCAKLKGSFAAVVVDPASRTLCAIKRGSSLYFGIGHDARSGDFAFASSDLSAVLRFTRVLLPLSEGEFVEFRPGHHRVYRLRGDGDPTPLERNATRSRLRVEDTSLQPPFTSFMEQEIAAQERTCRDVIRSFEGVDADTASLATAISALAPADIERLGAALEELRAGCDDADLAARFVRLRAEPALATLLRALPPHLAARLAAGGAARFASADAALFADIATLAGDSSALLPLRALDAFLAHGEAAEIEHAVSSFIRVCDDALRRGGRILALCCGSSFHAAKAAASFFDTIAATALEPILPGDFRARVLHSLRDGDVIVAVSQSGETKDLIDVLNDAAASGRDVKRIALVNNLNSTLAQEKCDVAVPLRCGVEVAVPATKSFLNQLVTFYCLALRLGRRRLATGALPDDVAQRVTREVDSRERELTRLPALVRAALDSASAELEAAAEHLARVPSLHVLATRMVAIAEEGALKVREVVLNHTEGFEASEFKHGPNTILGLDTIYGPADVAALLDRLALAADRLLAGAAGRPLDSDDRAALRAVICAPFVKGDPLAPLSPIAASRAKEHVDRAAFHGELEADYPLVFVTGPSERDVALTISQIHTHKIRGASLVVIAEENAQLRQAALTPPSDNADYRAFFVPLPPRGDDLLVAFTATIYLQRLALAMSRRKAAYLDAIGLENHGVHPDVPKNVSKSITVD
jgi:glucosamine--fructose-6-phosphate aminotransferase (isomerizing)